MELQSEKKQLTETNETMHLNIEQLRTEKEEHMNHIEEFRDQVANLKLNLKSREVSM